MSSIKNISNNILEVLELLPTGDYNISNIKNMTPHHWKTIEDYLDIFNDIKNSPIELFVSKKENEIQINLINKALNNISLPPESYYLIYLFLSKAFDKNKSIQLKADKNIIVFMKNSEMIDFNGTNKKIFLTFRGISMANTLIQMIKNNKFVSEEVLFQKGEITVSNDLDHLDIIYSEYSSKFDQIMEWVPS